VHPHVLRQDRYSPFVVLRWTGRPAQRCL